MTKSKKSRAKLPEQLSKRKPVQIQVNVPQHSTIKLDDMSQGELRHELETLPSRISAAREARDRLWSKLRERWSTAYSNDTDFLVAYARAEAAGQEVVYLLQRAVKVSRIYTERYSGKLL